LRKKSKFFFLSLAVYLFSGAFTLELNVPAAKFMAKQWKVLWITTPMY
jgi:hypothetical protein